MKTLLIIPAYNEACNIAEVVTNLIRNYPQYDYIVINDGSRDQTADTCLKNNFKLLDLPINIGLAGAVQAGMKFAAIHKYDTAIQFDGDGQHLPEYISLLNRTMIETKSDIVIGSRFKAADKPRGMRVLGSRILQALIKLTTRQTITDPTSGMRMFNRRMIEKFANQMNYGPEPDTLVYLINQGATVIEVPVTMKERKAGKSYLNALNAASYMLRMFISIIIIQWFRVKESKN